MKDYLKAVAFTISVIALGVISALNLQYDWQWERIPSYLISFEGNSLKAGPLLQGLLVTVKISVLSMVIALVLALVSALFRLSGSFTARLLAYIYIETIRNTPLLIQIFFMYFIIAPIFNISAFVSAVAALAVFEGAYASEIFRAGILSIRKGQWEASCSLGLTGLQTYRYVILPQALRRVLPPLTGQGVSLIKDSALVSTISIYDLTMRGQEIVAETFLSFEIWFTVAAIYLVVTVFLSFLVHALETHMKGT